MHVRYEVNASVVMKRRRKDPPQAEKRSGQGGARSWKKKYGGSTRTEVVSGGMPIVDATTHRHCNGIAENSAVPVSVKSQTSAVMFLRCK